MIWTLKILIIKSFFLTPSSFTFFFLPIALLYDSKPYDLWDILNVQNIFVMVSHGKLRGALKSDVTVT